MMSNLILPKDVDSKFRFITVAAQRAKQLQNGRQAARRDAQPQVDAHRDEEVLAGTRLVGGARRDARRRAAAERRARGVGALMPTVVLGVTGCIGAYKACEVLRELQKRGVDVHVVMTEHATRFVSPMTFEALSRHPVFLDQFALGRESDIRHICLADEADLLLVAPATANILGKFAHGIADDALSRSTPRPRRRCWWRRP